MKKLMGGRVRADGGESAIDLAERVRRDPHAQRILAEARDPVCRTLRKMVVPKPEVPTSEPKEVSLNLIAAGLCDQLGLTVAQLIEPKRTPYRHAARCEFARLAEAAGYDVYEIANYLQRERTTVLHMFASGAKV